MLFDYVGQSLMKEDLESFIVNINRSNLPPEKMVELVNQLHDISKAESIPLDQVPDYIKQKLEEKQKIDEQIKEVDAELQSKNVNIETINGYVKKLWNIQNLEWKEKELKDKCKKLSKRMSKFKDVLPLTENIAAAAINMNELLALKIAIDKAAKYYNLPFIGATMRLTEDIKKYNKINGLKEELSTLYLQKLAINKACSSQTESLITLVNLKSHGLTEDRILQLNHFLEKNGYEIPNAEA